MIIEYSRPARCKDCAYCSEFHENKKDGTPSKRKSYRCSLLNMAYISPNWEACELFKFETEEK